MFKSYFNNKPHYIIIIIIIIYIHNHEQSSEWLSILF